MSMLAERKRKQKWSLNPRGKDWSEDSNKFGQKMLEKMGWQHGKGLGANENGITEHVKISYKNDSKGMGYKESNDQWTEHQTNFSALLESLTGGKEELKETNSISLEKKSQSSRARVHYKKFTRGKDLSRYSEKDLANIFGKKSLKCSKEEAEQQDENKDGEEKTNENNSKFLFNKGSMRDYFKKKLPNFGKVNGYVVGNNGVLKREDSESESDMQPSFGFGFKQNDDVVKTYTDFGFKNEETPDENTRDLKAEVLDSTNNAKMTFVSYINNGEETEKRKNKKKRKFTETGEKDAVSPKKIPKKQIVASPVKKSKSNALEADLGIANLAFNPLCTPVAIQKHVLNTIEESISEDTMDLAEQVSNEADVKVPKKKKTKSSENPKVTVIEAYNWEEKKQLMKNMPAESENTSTESGLRDSTGESHRKKKRVKRNIEVGLANPLFNGDIEDEGNSVQEQNPYEVKIKKKERREADKFAIDNPNYNDSFQETTETQDVDNPFEVKVKEKKKKKLKNDKIRQDNLSLSEVSETLSDSTNVGENPYEIKLKEKRKKTRNGERFAIDNPYFKQDDSVPADLAINNAFEIKREKKKKNKEAGILNPALNVDNESPVPIKENISSNIEDNDLMLNIVSTPIVKKTKEFLKNALSNHNTPETASIKRRKSVRFSDVTQERIIPNNEDLKNMYETENNTEPSNVNTQSIGVQDQNDNFNIFPVTTVEDAGSGKRSKKRKLGLDNAAFDKKKNSLDENLDSISKTLDRYQAEIENDINEKKLETFSMDDVMIGDVGNPQGENEKLPEGTKLKFKYASFETKTPFYQLDKIGPKKSYKHLIKGDIVVKFKNTNLHEISGYAVGQK